jgi:hypothetical protein
MKARRLMPVCLPILLLSFAVVAQEASVTLHTTVSGNQEQPKVMYILPWQKPGDVQLEQEFSAGLAGELFVPQDRDEFMRQLNYQAMLDAAGSVATDADTDD